MKEGAGIRWLTLAELLAENPPNEPPAPARAPLTGDELLQEINERLKSQEAVLSHLRERVGCLYAYMIAGIIIGALAFIIGIMGGGMSGRR